MQSESVFASILSSLILLLDIIFFSRTFSKSSLSSRDKLPNELFKIKVKISPIISTPILVNASLSESEFCLTELVINYCDSVLTTWKIIFIPIYTSCLIVSSYTYLFLQVWINILLISSSEKVFLVLNLYKVSRHALNRIMIFYLSSKFSSYMQCLSSI